ncbi:GxxExxY protein [Mucilaginibacter pedocola]|uniref:GxxExxY protein n=1 Tax=Mucilaginibacter pedocola TaxID=1792845 RepID=A0A1S9PF78_9SPHI|nr:GxxExxY protein [Mucilaginibacter pedocola]OOQ59615.1 GxxExxY protein [Mucilaginibacter pedocola]
MEKFADINELTHKIIGCAMQVHSVIGCGFQEAIYQKSLAIELAYNGLAFEMEKEMHIYYRSEYVGTRRVDLFVEGLVMLELKALPKIEDIHKNQAINYLEIYNIADGLLINFGGTSLDFKRLYNKKLTGSTDHPYKK